MKKISLILVMIFVSWSAYSQTTKPDTLIIETSKRQKIILIGDDISGFRNVNSDSLINAALRKIRDSLRTTEPQKDVYAGLTPAEKKEKRKQVREESYSNKSLYTRNLKSNIPFTFKFNVGGGLIRNKFSPVFEAGISLAPQRQDYYSLSAFPSYTFINLTANRYYTFDQNPASSYLTYNNTFINASLGNRNNTKLKSHYLVSEFEMGLGYLVEREGAYFGENTFKIFGSVVTRSKFIRLTPEIYITDNLKKAFPGFSIKFF